MAKQFGYYQRIIIHLQHMGTHKWLHIYLNASHISGNLEITFFTREDETKISFMSFLGCQTISITFLKYGNQAIYLLSTSASKSAIQEFKTIVEYLIDGFINVANGSSKIYSWTFEVVSTTPNKAFKDSSKTSNG